jgi:predicted CopG family antitoxin
MSTKTIAIDSRVYARLSAVRREGESFSKAIDRLLNDVDAACTGRDILRRLNGMTALPGSEAATFLAIVAEDRSSEPWAQHDLR